MIVIVNKGYLCSWIFCTICSSSSRVYSTLWS